MKLQYKYAKPSSCSKKGNKIDLKLSPDLTREEKVSFTGYLKEALKFRDAMLMLREIVISDTRVKKKERSDYFNWLNSEITKKINNNKNISELFKGELKDKISELKLELQETEQKLANYELKLFTLRKLLNEMDIWCDYDRLERDFWDYIRDRDKALWWVLDPVITVHPDQISFEAFSLDESTYGCLSVDLEAFNIMGQPQLGTTNIDFSAKLAEEMERFRTYNEVKLDIRPEGLRVESSSKPEYLEKKIDLPDSWIKGFKQVSVAASLDGIELKLTPTDIYDILSFMKRHRARESPRSMKWILDPGKRIKIIFEPWNKEIELSPIYSGKNSYIERVWGRRRWLVLEKLLPLAQSFTVKFLGFGLPQFIIAHMGKLNLTVGFSSWSENDWVTGTALNVLGGYFGNDSEIVKHVLEIMRVHRGISFNNLQKKVSHNFYETNSEKKEDFKQILPKKRIKIGIGELLRKGLVYFDLVDNLFRYRQLVNVPLPLHLIESSNMESSVQKLLSLNNRSNFLVRVCSSNEIIVENKYSLEKPTYRRKYISTKIVLGASNQIQSVACSCRRFQSGPRNISSPCEHLFALYLQTLPFLDKELIEGRKYSYSDLELEKGDQ